MKKHAHERIVVPVDWGRLIARNLVLANHKVVRTSGTVVVDTSVLDGMVQNTTFSGGEPGETSQFLATVDVISECDGEQLVRKFKHHLTVMVRQLEDSDGKE